MSDAPVVLLHGTNAGPWTMAGFKSFFEENGFVCHSPAYRHHEGPPTEAQHKALVDLSIADYVDDIDRFVRTLDVKPILIGHSLGGVVAQHLAARGLARAVVLINGSVINGTMPTTAMERRLGKAFMATGPFWEETLLPDFETMSEFGLNRLPAPEQRAVFQRLGPEAGRVLFELFFWMFDENETTRIDIGAVDCPLLFLSGREDKAIPPSTAKTIAERYGDRATFVPLNGHGHYMQMEPGWETIARRALEWARAR